MSKDKNTNTLVNRTRLGSPVDNKIAAALKDMSEQTMIPMSKLLDEAITDLLKKRGYEIKE